MKYVISRYNHNVDWVSDYTDDVVMYDRSDKVKPYEGAIIARNVGSDLYDKFTFIIDNYDNLPDVAVYTKANIWKYITPKEFDKIKDNTTFTPILTKNHEEKPGVSFYSDDGMYNEINNLWYLGAHYTKHDILKLTLLLGIYGQKYVKFAPGSNYILPKAHILKHPRETYELLRSLLDWDVYPGEAMIIERGLYNLWK